MVTDVESLHGGPDRFALRADKTVGGKIVTGQQQVAAEADCAHAGDAQQLGLDFAQAGQTHLVTVRIIEGKTDLHLGATVGIKTEIHILQIMERADHQACPREQDHGESRLHDHEKTAQPGQRGAFPECGTALFQAGVNLGAKNTERGNGDNEQARDDREQSHHPHHAPAKRPAGPILRQRGTAGRAQQQREKPVRDEQAGQGSKHGQRHAFHREQADDAPPAATKGEPDTELAPLAEMRTSIRLEALRQAIA